jgi:hypothetical protein
MTAASGFNTTGSGLGTAGSGSSSAAATGLGGTSGGLMSWAGYGNNSSYSPWANTYAQVASAYGAFGTASGDPYLGGNVAGFMADPVAAGSMTALEWALTDPTPRTRSKSGKSRSRTKRVRAAAASD